MAEDAPVEDPRYTEISKAIYSGIYEEMASPYEGLDLSEYRLASPYEGL